MTGWVPGWLRAAYAGLGWSLVWAEVRLLTATGASLWCSWLVGRAVDVDVANGDAVGLTRTALLYTGLVVAAALLTWWARVSIERVAQTAMRRLKERLFAHVLGHDVALHDEEGSGRLLSRVTGDVEALRMVFSDVVLQAPGDILLFVGLFVVLGLAAPPLALVAAASLPFYLGLLVWYRRVSPGRFLASRAMAARLAGATMDHLRMLPVLRSFGRLEWARARARALNAEKFAVDYQAGLSGVYFFNALFAVRAGVLAAMVWVGAVLLGEGALTIGLLLVSLDYGRKMVEPFLRLQMHLTTVERAYAGAARVDALLARVPLIRSPVAPVPWPGLRDAIRFEAVVFAYVAGTPVLDGITLVVRAGTRVAVVGATGGGKTTLLQLLLRFRDPDAGRVTVDGVDVRELDLGELRRRVGLVSQSVQLLPGTVAENLGLGEGAAGRLLVDVGLAERLAPDTRVGEGGETLSRGETQLLCLARALAGDPEVLVLDEATASLDPQTEAAVSRLVGARPGCTLITVAHRLSTVVAHDRIVVIQAGRIAEEGDHASLLARGGIYAGLWQRQQAERAA